MNPGIAQTFNSLSSNKNFLACCKNTDNNTTQCTDLGNDHNISLSLKPFSNLELLVNQFNNATPENSNDPEKVCLPEYYDIEESITLKYLKQINCYPCFIQMHVLLKKIFDIIAISETRITKLVSSLNNLNFSIANLLQC